MAEFIDQFGIDWKLFLAQAVNFFILLFVLKRFAYGPIVELFKKRRQGIEEGIRMRAEAEKHLAEVDTLKEKILTDAEKEALLTITKAENAGKRHKEEILKDAGAKTEIMRAEAQRTIAQERATLRETLYNDTQELVRLGIARVLGKLPARERDAALIDEALRELKNV